MGESSPICSFQSIRNEKVFPRALPGYRESHVVYTALDFVLSFQVCHIAGIFPIDGCDYISNTQVSYSSLASGSDLEKGKEQASYYWSPRQPLSKLPQS